MAVRPSSGHQLIGALVRHDGYIAELQFWLAFASFGAPAAAGVIHQDVAHDACSDGEKVRARLPMYVLLADKTEIGLVDEGGRLKSVVRTLAAHVGVGEPMKLAVDERKE